MPITHVTIRMETMIGVVVKRCIFLLIQSNEMDSIAWMYINKEVWCTFMCHVISGHCTHAPISNSLLKHGGSGGMILCWKDRKYDLIEVLTFFLIFEMHTVHFCSKIKTKKGRECCTAAFYACAYRQEGNYLPYKILLNCQTVRMSIWKRKCQYETKCQSD